jgi:hypothetical protein
MVEGVVGQRVAGYQPALQWAGLGVAGYQPALQGWVA